MKSVKCTIKILTNPNFSSGDLIAFLPSWGERVEPKIG